MKQQQSALIKKTDPEEELRMVWAEVYAPSRPDAGGDFMDAKTIREMSYKFMKSGRTDQVDVMHKNDTTKGVEIVESFIAREDDQTFIPGSWVVGVHVPDDGIWGRIKSGELNGFSLEALAMTKKVEVELDIPPVVSGQTSKDNDHVHKFYVTFGDKGEFLGGKTDVQVGHFHVIKAGTVTEESKDHTHRFSSVDDLLIVEQV